VARPATDNKRTSIVFFIEEYTIATNLGLYTLTDHPIISLLPFQTCISSAMTTLYRHPKNRKNIDCHLIFVGGSKG
jgi:hypothetical protein